ncbi:transporter [Lactococcus hircilactis]|uniref:Transporter n=1 Tax=Lactococcus hircilactis TaxID=1494462 RepID=A0A7X1Z715_9LACT|nr:NusG domain II-containing protein [Lactococcus hircilactis]MQW38808.1 transporter [Lactococcus hircilactis]
MKFLKEIKIKPLDIVIVLFLFLSSFSVLAFLPKKEAGARAEVRVNGIVVKSFDLSQDDAWTYRSKNGQWNIIEVKNGKIRDRADNSPDQIAVHTGWISNVGQTAVCLPHHLVIEVMSGQKNNEVDYNA